HPSASFLTPHYHTRYTNNHRRSRHLISNTSSQCLSQFPCSALVPTAPARLPAPPKLSLQRTSPPLSRKSTFPKKT
ncbi:hypothetical protein ASPWEDRAFT_183884, partial [Aspergillus wentii DTO 134E9]